MPKGITLGAPPNPLPLSPLNPSGCTPEIRYDNETGKGDHRHVGDREERYAFKDVETLVADFLEDIEKARRA